MGLISPATVATQYGVPATTLRQWRRRGVGPEYFQFTPRTVSYSDDYLRDWFNDPRNAELLAENPPVNADTSCRAGRARQSRRPVDR